MVEIDGETYAALSARARANDRSPTKQLAADAKQLYNPTPEREPEFIHFVKSRHEDLGRIPLPSDLGD